MDKEPLRVKLQECLLKMSSEQRCEKSKKLCHNFISTPEFQDASVIMMYLSLPHEADICEAILHAWQLGKTVAVPQISWQQRHMIPVQIHSLETNFSTEVAGLRNPVKGVPIPFEEIDLVVTPALGFDKKGNRLGRGGAYYDRFFANTKLRAQRCGCAFKEQLLDSIPTKDHDQAMDFLVTDEKVIYFRPQTYQQAQGE